MFSRLRISALHKLAAGYYYLTLSCFYVKGDGARGEAPQAGEGALMRMHAQLEALRRAAQLKAKHPELEIGQDDFGHWYGDVPDGRDHDNSLEGLCAKLEKDLSDEED